MLKKNIGIIFQRGTSSAHTMNLPFITSQIIDQGSLYPANRALSYLAPLYIHYPTKIKLLFDNINNQKFESNMNPEIFKILNDSFINKTLTPEQIFYYIYAVLYSNIYREKYAEFLKIDFPRIPFTKNYDLFIKLGKLGKELADIHLMKSPQLNKTFSRFEVSGDNVVKKVEYVPVGAGLAPARKKNSKTNGNVFINKTQYFSNIDKNIWEYQIGGYQVMHKWLKDRKGRTLTLEDIQHYIKITKALQLTIEYQKKIDKLYPKVEKNLVDFDK